jgi:hypothetical protein
VKIQSQGIHEAADDEDTLKSKMKKANSIKLNKDLKKSGKKQTKAGKSLAEVNDDEESDF